jgi:hypothetical protein
MTTEFRIHGCEEFGEPTEPPVAAWPTIDASPIVRYPVPTRKDGYGHPAGVVGLPYCEFGRSKISATGLGFYMALFGTAPVYPSTTLLPEYVPVRASLYDPRALAWRVFTGYLWQPTFVGSAPGAYIFRDFRAVITDIQSTFGWIYV